MEGVGGRLGRSSTRYAPAAVFTGPVRKWKKEWVQISNPNAKSNPSNLANGATPASHLLLFKWTPVSPQRNSSSTPADDSSNATANNPAEAPPRRKFQYVPVSVIEDEKQESHQSEEADAGSNPVQSSSLDDKPDINDIPMEDVQALDKDQAASKKSSKTSLDLNLGA